MTGWGQSGPTAPDEVPKRMQHQEQISLDNTVHLNLTQASE